MAAEGDDYFPLTAGSTWSYTGSPLKTARLVRVIDVEESAEGVVFVWDGFSGERVVRKDDDGKVYYRSGDSWELLFDLGAEKDVSWTIGGPEGDLLAGSVAAVVSREEVVRLPFGVVEESLHLAIRPSPSLADAGLLEIWFGPGLGVIKWVEQTFAGPQTYELAGRGVSGSGGSADTTVVGLPDSSVVLPPGTVDPDSFVVLPPPIDPIPTPIDGFPNTHATFHEDLLAELATDRQLYTPGDTVKVRYRLTNRGEDVSLMFRSGQEFDVILEGANGPVWKWSEGQMFIQVLQSRTLSEGGSTEFEMQFVLQEEWVRPGDSFLLTAFLAVSADEADALDRSQTEAVVKFATEQDGGISPPGVPSGRVLAEMKVDGDVFDGSIEVAYRLTNVSNSPLVLFFPSGQRYDLYIDGPGGRVWTWSAVIDFIQVVTEMTLDPGETYAFEESITLQETGIREDGAYVLAGFLAVAVSDSIHISRSETEVLQEFVVNREGDGSGAWPPGPPPNPLPGSPLDKGLRVGVALDVGSDSVSVLYRLVNAGEEALQMMYRSGQQFDLVLDGPDGELWRWSEGRGFSDALWEESLTPGDSLVFKESFSKSVLGNLETGSYVLSAFAAVTPDVQGALARHETEARIKFRVQPGDVLNLVDLKAESDDGGVGASADFNTDGFVSFADFVMFAEAFGKTQGAAGFVSGFDLDGDGKIGFSDFIMFARAFNG